MGRRLTNPSECPPEEPRVTIEMGGPNVVIRSTPEIDRAYTSALAHAVDAAADTNTVVVIDPEPIRCDDSFAAHELPESETTCTEHDGCRPVAVQVIATGVIRIPAEHTSWTIDVGAGRFCQTDRALDIRFLSPEAWKPVVAICVTPTRLSALTLDGMLITSNRAHRPVTAELLAAS